MGHNADSLYKSHLQLHHVRDIGRSLETRRITIIIDNSPKDEM